MAGVFDLDTGAFDSSEAERLYEAYDIAFQGLRVSQKVDHDLKVRLARSILNVVRTEPDCLRFDGTIDPPRLAQRAILRMLQVRATAAPSVTIRPGDAPPSLDRSAEHLARKPRKEGDAANSTAKIMRHLFDRTVFAKL